MKKLRPNKDRSRYAIIAIWSSLAATCLLLLVEIYTAYLLNNQSKGIFLSIEEINNYLIIVEVSTIFVLAGNVVFYVFFIMWFRRAYFNLHTLFPKGRRYKEGWAAGAWFVPIMNLFGPNQIAGDLLSTTEKALFSEGLIEADSKRDLLKNLWWGFWIAGSIVSRISSRGTGAEEFFGILAIMGSLLLIVAYIMAIRFVKMYSELERLLPKLGTEVQLELEGEDDLLDSGL